MVATMMVAMVAMVAVTEVVAEVVVTGVRIIQMVKSDLLER